MTDKEDLKSKKELALQEAIGNMLPLLLSKSVVRIDSEVEGIGRIVAYWVINVLRIDIITYD